MNNATIAPEVMDRLKKMLRLALAIPAVLAFVFTEMQWYPATYAIDWLTNQKGEFSFKLAVAINFMFMAIPVALITAFVVLANNKKQEA